MPFPLIYHFLPLFNTFYHLKPLYSIFSGLTTAYAAYLLNFSKKIPKKAQKIAHLVVAVSHTYKMSYFIYQ
jgi:hypothetical protein